ncbi:MAG TPA: type II secretion system minor pseudopilin GspK [Nevskiaceae bacterium]|nr:type II secretion system minor pseudopilin GspK [Nevskiaceae bacterium]
MALITALLVVALAVIAATAVVAAGNLAIHRAGNLQDSERASWYALGVEDWVRSILERDARDNQIDSLLDDWAQPVDYLPIDQGFVRGGLVDLQGRFNLNNLGTENPEQFTVYAQQFDRLLETLASASEGSRVELPQGLAEAIRDWIDADSEPTGFNGAEDSEYLSRDPPYRAANQPLRSVGELLAIKGIDKTLFALLKDHVAVLPASDTRINVNTATEPVLRSLVAGGGGAEFEDFLRRRSEEPADDVQSLYNDGVFSAADAVPNQLSVASQFFQLRAETYVGNGRVALYSLYYRPAGGVPLVLARSTDSD